MEEGGPQARPRTPYSMLWPAIPCSMSSCLFGEGKLELRGGVGLNPRDLLLHLCSSEQLVSSDPDALLLSNLWRTFGDGLLEDSLL